MRPAAARSAPASAVVKLATRSTRAGAISMPIVIYAALMHGAYGAVGQAIAQEIETIFLGGAVGDIASVDEFALLRRQVLFEHADRQPEQVVDSTEEIAISLGQIIVKGDNMHTFAIKRKQVCDEGSRQCFSFTGFHF